MTKTCNNQAKTPQKHKRTQKRQLHLTDIQHGGRWEFLTMEMIA